MADTGTPHRAGRAPGLALGVLCGATLMIILDGTIVTVALPAIQHDLGFSAAGLTWVMNAYLIAFGGLLLAGRLGDLLGARRLLLSGLVLFTGASLACGLSAGPVPLIAARFAQGAGAAMISAVSLGMIVGLYAEPRPRARAIGAYSFVGAAGASVGLVLGGVLTQALSWHWIFFVNLPLGALAAGAGRLVLPAGPAAGGRLRHRADGLGALLVTAGLMTAVYALVGTARYGWASAHTLGLLAAAAAAITAFAVREATAARPLLRLGVLASRRVSGANLTQALVIAAAFGFQVQIILYLQRVLHYPPARAGLGLLPTAVVIGLVSLGGTARLAARFGERAVLLAGLALITAALAGLAGLPAHGRYAADVLPALLAFGAGGGLTLPALATLGMSDATPADAGVVSGLFSTTQQVGAAIGVALLSTVAAGRSGRLRADGLATAAALAGGYRLAFAVGAGLAAAFIVAATVLRGRRSSRAPGPARARARARRSPPNATYRDGDRTRAGQPRRAAHRMFERFTERARQSVVLGQEEAVLLQHSYYGTEHLLLGLVREGSGAAARALSALDISLEAVRGQVTEMIGRGSFTSGGHIPFTPGAKKALERSLPESLVLGDAQIGTGHILLGLIHEDTGAGARILVRLGAGLDLVREHVLLALPGGDTDDPLRAHGDRPGNDAT